MIFLGVGAPARLGGGVLFAAAIAKSFSLDLGSHPRWLVVLVGTLVAMVLIWILMKLLKVGLWLLMFAVLLGGLAWAGWLMVR